MEKPSEVKLETIFIAWCEAIEKPNGHGIFPFDAFKEGFNQGMLFASLDPQQADAADAKSNCDHNWIGLHGHPAAFECQSCGALRR